MLWCGVCTAEVPWCAWLICTPEAPVNHYGGSSLAVRGCDALHAFPRYICYRMQSHRECCENPDCWKLVPASIVLCDASAAVLIGFCTAMCYKQSVTLLRLSELMLSVQQRSACVRIWLLFCTGCNLFFLKVRIFAYENYGENKRI